MIYAGIDAGSRAIKFVLLNGETLETAHRKWPENWLTL